MSLFISAIASGSNGNCYYIGNENEAILIDAGISCREIETRMKQLHLQLAKIKAVFISHEHSDHIKGLPVLAKKYKLPVYVSTATLNNCSLKLDKEQVNYFNGEEEISLGDLKIAPFSKPHDAADPYSFMVSHQGINVGVFTDIGTPCHQLSRYFRSCHAAFLESNYDGEMLANGSYPWQLKNRIRGGNGHLSNKEALQVFKDHRAPFLSHLILSHLSKNNNSPTLVKDLFLPHAHGVEIIIASRYEATPVYRIGKVFQAANLLPEVHRKSLQLQLSF